MKKQISLLILIMISVFCIVGCNNMQNKSQSQNSSKENQNKTENINNSNTSSDIKGDTIKIAMDLNCRPFRYINDKNLPDGLEVDMANELGKFLGKKVEIINTNPSKLISSIQSKKVDIAISGMSKNKENYDKVNYSKPYMYANTIVMVNRDFVRRNNLSNTTMNNYYYNDVNGMGLNITESDLLRIPNLHVLVLADMSNLENLPMNTQSIQKVNDVQDAIVKVNKGEASAFVTEDINIGNNSANTNNMYLYNGIKSYSDICIAVNKDEKDLLNKINNFITSLNAKGGFYEKESKKYDKSIGDYLRNKNKSIKDLINKPK